MHSGGKFVCWETFECKSQYICLLFL
jgi:hypothetical protein